MKTLLALLILFIAVSDYHPVKIQPAVYRVTNQPVSDCSNDNSDCPRTVI